MATNLNEVFKVADTMDAIAFSKLLTKDVRFRFSNNDVWTGRGAVISGLNYLFSRIIGLKHNITGVYSNNEGYAVEALAKYTMKDAKAITLPVVSVLKYEGNLIKDYRIYMDISPVMNYAVG